MPQAEFTFFLRSQATLLCVTTHPFQESNMDKNAPVRINLTKEQQEAVRTATGKDAEAIELSAEELEERIAPRTMLNP
jgi:hypothetical protein